MKIKIAQKEFELSKLYGVFTFRDSDGYIIHATENIMNVIKYIRELKRQNGGLLK
jgi:hypothetical protein